jgi:hypothetical protein
MNPRAAANACLGLALLWALAGCQQAELEANRQAMVSLDERLDALAAEVQETRAELAEERALTEQDRELLATGLADVSGRLEALPETLSGLCPEAPASTACDNEVTVQRVVVSADKMLVGELEYVWIDPPGVTAVARIDTGATSSSVNADNVMPFERDGDDWVRFDMIVSDKQVVTVERQVVRYARVIQQADPDGSRRPVVEMRVSLGDVPDTFEFTLADRSHLENDLILGRNFLTDVSLVDVGRRFIQPRPEPAP